MNTNLYMRHDNDLAGHPDILAARTRGASLVRLTLARMYGRSDLATASGWQVVPHVTERDTIGVVDVATGTAWDSMIPATDDVHALGLDEEHTPDGNHPSLGGDVRFDGELVQRRGETPDQPITAPPGWQRIGLPTWRGYGNGADPDTDPGRYVPVPPALYQRDQRIRPRLRAVGLMTCYGYTGLPLAGLPWATGLGGERPEYQRPRLKLILSAIPDAIAHDLVLAARERCKALMLHVARAEPWIDELRAAIEADDRSRTWKLAQGRWRDDSSYTAIQNDVFWPADDDTRLAGHVLSVLGDDDDQTLGLDWYGILIDVRRRVAMERTREARQRIEDTLEQASATHAEGERNTHSYFGVVMKPLVKTVAEWLMDGAPGSFIDQLRAILYRDGPIYVDVPAASVERP